MLRLFISILILVIGFVYFGGEAQAKLEAGLDPTVFINGGGAADELLWRKPLAVPHADNLTRQIMFTIHGDPGFTTSFAGATTISKYDGVSIYRITIANKDSLMEDYIADARVIIHNSATGALATDVTGTVIRIKEGVTTTYFIFAENINDNGGYVMDIELKNVTSLESAGEPSILTQPNSYGQELS